VDVLRVYGLVDVLPRAAFTINSPLNSAYKTILVSSSINHKHVQLCCAVLFH